MNPVVRANGLDEIDAEPFLSALVRSSDDAIIGKTPDGRVVFWNAAAERLYGYEAAEMIGRDISVLVPEDRPEELAMIMAEVAAGKDHPGTPHRAPAQGWRHRPGVGHGVACDRRRRRRHRGVHDRA